MPKNAASEAKAQEIWAKLLFGNGRALQRPFQQVQAGGRADIDIADAMGLIPADSTVLPVAIAAPHRGHRRLRRYAHKPP